MDQIINFAKSAMEDKRQGEQQEGGNGAYSGPGGFQAQQQQQQDYQQQGNLGGQQGYGQQQQAFAPSVQQGGFGQAQGQGYAQGQGNYGLDQSSYQQNQSFQGQQGQGGIHGGGEQFNRPHGSGGASNAQAPQLDASATIAAAQQSGGDSSLFSTALGFLGGLNKQDADDLDEDDVQRKHDQAYNQQGASNMSANGLGAAAALQAFKKFTSGDQDAKKAEQGGGDMMSKLVGLAMGEAGSMFDKTGGTASGTKQDAVSSAGQTIMKLLIKNQVSGMMGGGNSGGLGGLMSMASKFM